MITDSKQATSRADDSEVRPASHVARGIPWIIAAVVVILELARAGLYGIHGDEYYYLACGEHLDFGYVDHPPMIALLTRLVAETLGESVFALRLLPALAGGGTVLLAVAIARRLGGQEFAMGLAALSVACSAGLLALFNFLSMNAFDILLITLASYLLIGILREPSPRRWLLFGFVAGVGLQTKMTMLVFGFAAVLGLLLTRRRALLADRWIWLGGALALLIFLPNVIWQAAHDWPTLEFIGEVQSIRNPGHTVPAFLFQLSLALNPLTLPVWLAGLVGLLLRREWRELRPLGVLAVVFLAVYVASNPQVYYVFAIVPLLYAAGAVVLERAVVRWAARWARPLLLAPLVASGVAFAPLVVSLLPVETLITYSKRIGLMERIEMYDRVQLPIHFSYRFGWPEMARAVSEVYDALPAAEQERCVILATNYGRTCSLNRLGRAYDLPPAYSGHNSCWFWLPEGEAGEVAISVGYSEAFLTRHYRDVQRVATFTHPYVMAWETSSPICICRDPIVPLAEAWPEFRNF